MCNYCKMYFQLVLAILTIVLRLDCVSSDFTFEVRLHSYNNPTHTITNGYCCDTPEQLPPNCFNPCDNMFSFCFRDFGRRDNDLDNCTQGRFETGLIDSNNDQLFFPIGDFPSGVSNPVVISGSRWLGTIQVAIKVLDFDNSNPEDCIDIFFLDIITNITIPTFSDPTTFPGKYFRGNLELSYRLSCNENYYGPDCATFCMERDDDLGHYICSDNGSIICRPGFEDPSTSCTSRASDECTSNEAAQLATVIQVAGGVGGLLLLIMVILSMVIIATTVVIVRQRKTVYEMNKELVHVTKQRAAEAVNRAGIQGSTEAFSMTSNKAYSLPPTNLPVPRSERDYEDTHYW